MCNIFVESNHDFVRGKKTHIKVNLMFGKKEEKKSFLYSVQTHFKGAEDQITSL